MRWRWPLLLYVILYYKLWFLLTSYHWKVERALKQWSTGWYEPDTTNFSATEWGAETFDLLAAVNDLPEAKWERIICAANEYIARYKKLGTFKANFTTRILSKQLSGRATILSSDGEISDASMASDVNQ